MKFTTSVVVAALAAIASAKPKITNTNFNVVPGQAFELKWSEAKGPVTIELKSGTPPDNMKTFLVLATDVAGTSASVMIPKDVPTGQYAFTVADGKTADDTNYSIAFSLVGTGSSSSSSSSAPSSSSSSSSVTSSASSSSATTMTTSASVRSNSTSTSASATSSSGSTSTRPSTTSSPTGSIPNSNSSGSKVQSSLALVMLGAVAYAFLN